MTEEEDKRYEPKRKKLKDNEQKIKEFCEQNGYQYKMLYQSVLINTKFGLWQLRIILGNNNFQLMHHNNVHNLIDLSKYSKYKSLNQWHYQYDFSVCKDMGKALKYIHSHDISRKQEKEDINKMPTNTKLLRIRKQQAKNRKRRNNINKVYELCDKVNGNNKDKDYYHKLYWDKRSLVNRQQGKRKDINNV